MRKLMIFGLVVIVLYAIGSASDAPSTNDSAASFHEIRANNEAVQEVESGLTASVAVAQIPQQETILQDPTMGQANALAKVQSYLDYSAFSASGLIEQLEYEGFSTADAQWAVEHYGADWNEQAAAKAQSYLDYSSFSRQRLIDQLVYEGFTPGQAAYGVNAVYGAP